MTKGECVAAVAEHMECSKAEAGRMVNGVLDVIVATLENHEDVNLAGFGSFKSVYKEATTARNPSNGETIDVPAHYTVRFKVASNVKAAVK